MNGETEFERVERMIFEVFGQGFDCSEKKEEKKPSLADIRKKLKDKKWTT